MTNEERTAAELEAEARAIYAAPWEPPPGMVTKRCPGCRYFFAVPVTEAEVPSRCPDCASKGTKGAAARRVSGPLIAFTET